MNIPEIFAWLFANAELVSYAVLALGILAMLVGISSKLARSYLKNRTEGKEDSGGSSQA